MTDDAPKIPERDHAQRSFAVPCESCEGWTERSVGPRGTRLPDSVTCGSCGTPHALDLAGHLDEDDRLGVGLRQSRERDLAAGGLRITMIIT